ncbi:MAG: hypothetical protein LBJ69_03530 [Holosporales bacterium]|jgi:hypothetical protein|nr:hypothetical protein [Holosporales bacterium]
MNSRLVMAVAMLIAAVSEVWGVEDGNGRVVPRPGGGGPNISLSVVETPNGQIRIDLRAEGIPSGTAAWGRISTGKDVSVGWANHQVVAQPLPDANRRPGP